MDSIEQTQQTVLKLISGSRVPEDLRHALNTLEWLLRLDPNADDALRVAALSHDVERAIEARKVRRSTFRDYEAFKAAHAENSARILREIMEACGTPAEITDEACRLVRFHETGGDPRSEVLKNADAISFFDVNLPAYYEREGHEEAKRRCIWGYRRLSPELREAVAAMRYPEEGLRELLMEAIREASR